MSLANGCKCGAYEYTQKKNTVTVCCQKMFFFSSRRRTKIGKWQVHKKKTAAVIQHCMKSV